MRKLSYKIADYFIENDYVDTKEYNKVVYGVEVIKTGVIQLSVIIILGSILNKLPHFLMFFIGFGVLRTKAGGFHMDTIFKCTTLTVSFIVLALIFTKIALYYNSLNIVNLVIMLISVVLIFKLSPVENEKRPLKESEKVKFKNQSILLIFVLSGLIISITFLNANLSEYLAMMNFGIFFEALTLISFK
jgi:accessory gene regulator B